MSVQSFGNSNLYIPHNVKKFCPQLAGFQTQLPRIFVDKYGVTLRGGDTSSTWLMDPISAMRDNNLSGMRDIPRSLGIVKRVSEWKWKGWAFLESRNPFIAELHCHVSPSSRALQQCCLIKAVPDVLSVGVARHRETFDLAALFWMTSRKG
ncbi:hypothetical protein An16g07670 [Aspergillus niger]|uniref:Uncharacterized protein n=2 Tax=Aspergillus niger TaxID=5061 RepID=A2R8M4_ASPNC|nr:hypothetical protein An16g07670 [Aspergillus niger]CAL00539.1 hypothetical protein An16g07670 [Aspergillus niger]